MENIQDLKDKIFSESRNIIDILSRINNVEELLSKHDQIKDLAEKTSFLTLLNQTLDHYNEESAFSENSLIAENETFEEEAVFNNELNEIGKNFDAVENNVPIEQQEEVFNHQIEEIIESNYYEEQVNSVEENQPEANVNFVSDEISDHLQLEEEAVFNNQLNEIDDEEPENTDQVLSFVDENRILEDSEPENENDFNEEIFNQEVTEEELVFNDQLNEINEEQPETQKQETQIIPDIFETEENEDEILIEEKENEYHSNEFNHNQEEIISESSNVETILNEIKKDSTPEIAENPVEETEIRAEDSTRRKIIDIDKEEPETNTENLKSDQNFENIEAYRQEKKIKLAHIRGLKNIQTLFDDDPLEREIPQEKVEIPVVKEDTGSLIKTNIPTDFMEAEKRRPEFKLDLNDRIAFTKVLFGGSQTDLNNAMTDLNNCRNLEEAKEFLSDLYYAKKWEKVDDYAQRLWILVENKFA